MKIARVTFISPTFYNFIDGTSFSASIEDQKKDFLEL